MAAGPPRGELHTERKIRMKGNEKILAELNALLAEELTAINQYIVHAEMCDNWGYEKLHDVSQKRAIDEMKHAEKLIARILFLEGQPIVSKLNPIQIGQDVPAQFANDVHSEYDADKHYNAVIRLCVAEGDNVTKELLDDNLKDEERHIDVLEAMQDQVKQMGVQIFLGTKN
jgi:bacterioferritin